LALPAEQVLQNYLETLWDPVWEQLLVSHHFAPSLRSVLLFADDGKLSLEEFQAFFSDGTLNEEELEKLFHTIDSDNTK